MSDKRKNKVVLHIRTKMCRSACIAGCEDKQWVVDINAWIDKGDGTMLWKPSTSFAFSSKRKPVLKSELFNVLCAAGLIDWNEA